MTKKIRITSNMIGCEIDFIVSKTGYCDNIRWSHHVIIKAMEK